MSSISDKIRYGAAELKAAYNRNLGIALGISVGVHLLLIFLYIFIRVGQADSRGKTAPIARIKLTNLAPPPPPTDVAPPPPPPMVPPDMQHIQSATGTGLAVRAGTPIAVPDALVTPDMGDFANNKDMSAAGTKAGNGELPSFNPDDLNKNGTGDQGGHHDNFDSDADPDPEAFNPDIEEQPSYDDADLNRRVKYPEIARRNSIEGKVVIRALIGKDGHVEKTIVLDGAGNKSLADAAIAAIEETAFTPAKQNKTPVKVWITIPVTFSLNN
jgi:protein TonB